MDYDMVNRRRGFSRHELRVVIGLTVAVVWLTISIGSLFIRDYTALSVVTPVMVIVTGFLFAKSNGD